MDDELPGCGRVLLFLAIGLPVGFVAFWVGVFSGWGMGLSNNAAGSLGLVTGALVFWYGTRIIQRWLRGLGRRETLEREEPDDDGRLDDD